MGYQDNEITPTSDLTTTKYIINNIISLKMQNISLPISKILSQHQGDTL